MGTLERPAPNLGPRRRDPETGAIWTQDANGFWSVDPGQQAHSASPAQYEGMGPIEAGAAEFGYRAHRLTRAIPLLKALQAERGISETDWENLSQESARQHPLANVIGGSLPSVGAGIITGGGALPMILGQTAVAAGAASPGRGGQDALWALGASALPFMGARVASAISNRAAALRGQISRALEQRAAAAAGDTGLEGSLVGMPGKVSGSAAEGAGAGGFTGTAESRRLGAEAERLGYKFLPGEIEGDPTKRLMIAAQRSTPGQADVIAREIDAPNNRLVNRTWARALGEEGAADVGTGTRAQAADRIGKVYEQASSAAGKLSEGETESFISAAKATVEGIADRGADVRKLETFVARVEKVAKRSGGGVNGEQLGLWRSELGSMGANAPAGTNPQHFFELQDVVDDALHKRLSSIGRSDMADALESVRPQYKTLMILEHPNAVDAFGHVNPQSIGTSVRMADANAFNRLQFRAPKKGSGPGVADQFQAYKDAVTLSRVAQLSKPVTPPTGARAIPLLEHGAEVAGGTLGALIAGPLGAGVGALGGRKAAEMLKGRAMRKALGRAGLLD